MRIFYLVFIYLIVISSCQVSSKEPNTEIAISSLTMKFPQLPRGKSKQTDFYNHIRTITFGENKNQLEFWSTPDSIKDCQGIIVLSNENNQQYAIPLLSNKYRDYWNFEFDKSISGVDKINTTFEAEVINALNTLNFNDTLGSCNLVLNELLKSLMQTESVYELSSEVRLSINDTHDNNLQEEKRDSCLNRSKLNFEAIEKGMKPFNNYHIYNAFWDRKANRIYQVLHKTQTFSTNCDISIKVYRQDCNSHLMDGL